MATLLALLALAEAGRGQVVGVVGEAGMGNRARGRVLSQSGGETTDGAC